MPNPVELSIVVPCHNEQDNLPLLVRRVGEVLDPIGVSYEIVVTDDASTDRSWEVLLDLAKTHPKLLIQRFKFNCGESAASWAGMQASTGKIIVTMDADLQNDPADLPKFLAASTTADCICGTRVETRGKGDHIIRVLSSRIANSIRNSLSGENITDAGCTYRAFKRECISHIKFFKGMHRFLPTLIKMEGYSVSEIAVTNNQRHSGSSHYGVWNRLFKSFHDLLAVRWMKTRMIRYEIAEQLNTR